MTSLNELKHIACNNGSLTKLIASLLLYKFISRTNNLSSYSIHSSPVSKNYQ